MTSTTHNPTVSVGIPVYNGENFVAEAIESLLGQTFEDFELIISDNASTDGTREICEHFAGLDPRVRYHRADVNQGAKWNFPNVFHLARGKYFKWAAHDDLCAPTMIEKCVGVMEADSSVVMCMPRTAIINSDSRLVLSNLHKYTSGCETDAEERERLRCLSSPRVHERYLGVLLRSLRCYEVFALVRRDAMAKSGLYRGYNGSEKVFLAEMALMGRFVELDEDLFYSRWHDSRFSSNTRGTGQNDLVSPKKSKKFAVPHEILCGVGYFRRMLEADISLLDRLRCLGVWGRFVLRPEKWKVILAKLLTGHSNTVELPDEPQLGDRVQIGALPWASATPGDSTAPLPSDHSESNTAQPRISDPVGVES